MNLTLQLRRLRRILTSGLTGMTFFDDGDIFYSINEDPFRSKNGKINWERSELDTGKTREANKMSGKPGVQPHTADRVKSIRDLICFFTVQMQAVILLHTNAEGKKRYDDSWKELLPPELIAYVGLLLLMGVFKDATVSAGFVVYCRWTIALDICGLNAYVIWTELNPEWNKSTSRRRCEFLKELGKELVKPFVESTRSKIPGLSHASKRTIKEMMASHNFTGYLNFQVESVPAEKGKRKRCVHCTSYRQSWLVCSSCVQNVCGEHSKKSTTVLCRACF
ncbi:hypothetical protein BV898_15334 [Hypsibius exemplaris]|uniref:PiggyBac transposable element-derived protein domain-containing protein n=1 Tax=Hypsibius exemplaris TaxID=2072580 RepID=A0A9X6NK16_HYPEX|nr:hypothetical protein BV898_15334 [Hypsibius exemplaris]